jgi:hypothetical protein
MRGKEALYGYGVTAELVLVAVLNLLVTHGKGAPTHPATTISVIGLVVALALPVAIRTNNRTIGGLGAVVAAFFVALPRVPNSLQMAHILAFVLPIAYSFTLTQRQRKLATAEMKARRATAAAQPRPARRRRARKDPEPPKGPQPSRRYTPPKAKRVPDKKR